MKFIIVIDVEYQEKDLSNLILAWMDNQTNTTLEVFNPYSPEEKVGEIVINEITSVEQLNAN